MATQVKRAKMDVDGTTVQSLSWDHPVCILGVKNTDPSLLNCCMKCTLPIYRYGRMIPCKHVLCFDCANQCVNSQCLKCGDKVTKVDENLLGTVFVCSYGSARHAPGGCRRSYLSQRDLDAHMKHRHKKKDTPVQPVVQIQQPALISMTQSLPNMAQPPPQFMRPPNHITPQMMNRPPPGIMNPGNPPHHPVSMQQGHPMQNNPVTMQTNPVTMQVAPMQRQPMQQMQGQATMPQMQAQGNLQPMQANQLARPMPMMQSVPPNQMSQRMPRPANTMTQHQMASHPQQIPGGARPHAIRHQRPPQAQVRPIQVTAPAQSKSHGNLISIPIQGTSSWQGQTNQQQSQQQQWSNQQQGGQQQQHHY